MPAAGLDADAAALMRSLLFVPADGGTKLEKALGCGIDPPDNSGRVDDVARDADAFQSLLDVVA